MDVKIDTKEKFTVVTPATPVLSAIMTEQLCNMLLGYKQKDIQHIVLNMQNVAEIAEAGVSLLANTQQDFYEHNCSLVICCLQSNVENLMDNMELLEVMNVTPTESEAWDIVQMEEIERELLNDE